MNDSPTTEWARAGFGLWRREQGVVLRVKTHNRSLDLAAAVGVLSTEVSFNRVFILGEVRSEDEGKAWCERWAQILLKETK